MPRSAKNIGASVRARLLAISKEKGQNFDLVLTHYAIERLLYRLAQSRYADRFVLKGAMLLMTWFNEPFRGTRDLDLLGYGDPTPEAVLAVIREVLGLEQPDGVVFDTGAVRVTDI
ncbi:MAG: nucleotidyl transferase AbiEii/AbiGii toxin family protein, partial [Gammaproteobacteria bacterium]|nr:nucleotidyl transferase AbiEii/AbiGii toxin family protein [Gammaproteobacteria bacterium]